LVYIFGVVFYRYFWNGAPSYPDDNQAKKIEQATNLIRQSSFWGWINIPTTILILDHKGWWGLSPRFAPMSIYLRKDLLDFPIEMIASTIVHESIHQLQLPFIKPFWVWAGGNEKKAYLDSVNIAHIYANLNF
jgi:hypothetical protein